MIKYGIVETVRRIVQMIFGTQLFDLPLLSLFRKIMYRAVFDIGKSPTIGSGVKLCRSHKMKDGKIKIGKEVFIAKEALIDYSGNIEMKDNVWISERVQIHTHIHNLTPERIYEKGIEPSSIVFEDRCWLGAGVIVLPSVKRIGKDAVIGAGSVVTKDVEDNTVVAGNPARIIRRIQYEQNN